ncbi:hypothetical protein KIN20_032173 [Parelaphostrongylus tenuis]|uniref:C2H2-type domain-containing protein n=1 Tax=Parelaphostrongylus tenuis TaxID=148309 RepID=A0AAD5WIB1_PARTN|nr:hypothetical protein KIN20_032173 [Parelaphostrongylus tenuis]
MMSSRAENGSHNTRKTNVWRPNHTCLICQDVCPSPRDKENHENQMKHKRKLLVYDFFAKEVPKSQKFIGSSVLWRRYTACDEQAMGLECLHELHFSFTSMPWWACSICYESGVLMEQADMHVFSMSHIETYLDEFHSDKFSKAKMVEDPLKVFDEMKRLCNKVFEEQGRENLPPECLIMDSHITGKDAMTRLAVKSSSYQPSYNLHMDSRKNGTTRKILECLICHQLLACNDELLKRVWDKHELSVDHRRAVAVTTFLEQFKFEGAVLPDVVTLKRPLTWRMEKDLSYGPVCGLKFLVIFNRGNFCRLCYTPVESIESHFSSEYHIMQFLAVSYPVKMFEALQYENEQSRRVHIDWFPRCLAAVLKLESHVFPTLMPALSPLGRDSNCLFCPVCLLALEVVKDIADGGEALWNFHCGKLSHFQFSIRRACLFFDKKFFVPMSSSVSKAPKMLHGHWFKVKVVCTLCARWFAHGRDPLIYNHIRSFEHFYHYVHANNRNLLSMLLVQKTRKASRELMLEWLQRLPCDDYDEMRSYSPQLTLRMLHWGNIPIRKVEAASHDSEHRPVFECLISMVDKVAGDNAENLVIPVKEALDLARVKVLALKEKDEKVERMLCRCMQCGLVFSTSVNAIVTNVWDSHLSSQGHFARFQAFMSNRLDMSGFSEKTSSYTVKPFKHQDPSNKVAWHWSAEKNAHDFVLTVIGLEDLVERRSSETDGIHSPDFFCRLCALVISRDPSSLEAHVRSMQHVLNFVHKYHPDTIMEIDSLPEGGKEMRKILAQLLKFHEPSNSHCIPIYDPVGEQKRKALIAMQKARDEERECQLVAEARRQAEEQQQKNEEKQRKQREVEIFQEERKRAGRIEKEIHGRGKRFEGKEFSSQKLHTEHKEATRKVKDDRETVSESERETKGAERSRRQDELRMLLDKEKQRLKALQMKEATQRHLIKEKDMFERTIRELEKRHEEIAVQRSIPSFVGSSRYMSSMHMKTRPIYPTNRTQEIYQQLRYETVSPDLLNEPVSRLETVSPDLHNEPVFHFETVSPRLQNRPVSRFETVSPDLLSAPVPSPTSPFSIPPSGKWRSQECASQTLFKTHVPFADTFEEQTRLEEAENAISRRVKQSELECQNVIARPSLRERKVDPYILNGSIIQSRDQLVDFIWRQGAERIPTNELPVKFNQKAAEIEGALGVDSLYEVVCVDCSDMDTFYCSMCGVWTTPNDMFEHLETTSHKLAYLFRNYKMYHQAIVSEPDFLARSAKLNEYAIKIWKMENPPRKVTNRLRSLLDRATIERIWPECITILDHSWKDEGRRVGRVEVPSPISKQVLNLIDEESIKLKKNEKLRELKQFEETINVKGKDKHSSSSKEREKKKDDKEKMKSNRSRKRRPTTPGKPKQRDNRRQTSPVRKRHRSRSLERRKSCNHRHLRDSSCSYSKHGHRDRSHSRNRGRSRSRSHATSPRISRRTIRRSRSRSKIENVIENSGLSWEATAAAFLTKLGDPRGAALVSQPSNNSTVFDEKVEQRRNFAQPQPTAHTSSLVNDFLEHQERLKKLQEILTISDSDEKAQMRKLLGVLITMQQEAERYGSINKSMVDKLYQEVGLKKSVDSTEQLLAQLCSQISHKSESNNKTVVDLHHTGSLSQKICNRKQVRRPWTVYLILNRVFSHHNRPILL